MGTIKENYEMMFTSYPDLVDITQLKEMLGIGITLAYRLVRNKTIKSLKVGRQYKIPKRNVIAYLTNQNEIQTRFRVINMGLYKYQQQVKSSLL